MKRSVTISIRVSPETKAVLDGIASAEKRTIAQLARILVEEALEARAKAAKPRAKK